MTRFGNACFCYCLLRAYKSNSASALHKWLVLFQRRGRAGRLTIGSDVREWWADWAIAETLRPVDFEQVVKVLTGDEFFKRNMKDVAKLEREVGKSVIELWDTDPIFGKYPHLRGLARNTEFEILWNKRKQKVK